MSGSLLFKSVRDLSLAQASVSWCACEVIDWGRGRGLGGRSWPSFGGTRLLERPTTRIISHRQAETASLFPWFFESEILESLKLCWLQPGRTHMLDPSAAGVSTNNLYNVCVHARKTPSKKPAAHEYRHFSISFFSLSSALSPPRRSHPHRCRRRRSSRLFACFDASVAGVPCGSSWPPNRPCCSMHSCP